MFISSSSLCSLFCLSCTWIPNVQNKLASRSSMAASSRILTVPRISAGSSTLTNHPVLNAIKLVHLQTDLHFGSRDCGPPAFKFPITFAKYKPLVGVSETDRNLHSNELVFQMFSVFGIMLLMTAFLYLVFRFHLSILCPVAGLCNGFFKNCKKTLHFSLSHWGHCTQNAPDTFRPFLFWILKWKNREEYQDFFKNSSDCLPFIFVRSEILCDPCN